MRRMKARREQGTAGRVLHYLLQDAHAQSLDGLKGVPVSSAHAVRRGKAMRVSHHHCAARERHTHAHHDSELRHDVTGVCVTKGYVPNNMTSQRPVAHLSAGGGG